LMFFNPMLRFLKIFAMLSICADLAFEIMSPVFVGA
jgi:hypothetical protein